MEYCFDISSEQEMLFLGEKIANRIKRGAFIALYGELGAGKTVLVKGIANGLNVKERVTSPTFTIMCQYFGKKELYHFDLYRVSEDDCYSMGFDDFFFDPDVICAVEWSEHLSYLPENTMTVTLEKTGKSSRRVIINDSKEIMEKL